MRHPPFSLQLLMFSFGFWQHVATADPKRKFDIFESDVAAFMGFEGSDLNFADTSSIREKVQKAYVIGTVRWHPDNERVLNKIATDPRIQKWVEARVEFAKQTAKTEKRRFKYYLARNDALVDLQKLAFHKVSEAKRAFDIWLQNGGAGAVRFCSADPILDHPAWVAKYGGRDTEGNTGTASQSSWDKWTEAPPPRKNPDFDYLRNGTSADSWAPKQNQRGIVADSEGKIKKSTAVFDSASNSWFEMVTGTTFVWNSFYNGFVNFELGMYFIPATNAKETFIYDPYGLREFSPHLNGWWNTTLDLKKKVIPKELAGKLPYPKKGNSPLLGEFAVANPPRQITSIDLATKNELAPVSTLQDDGSTPPIVSNANPPFVRKYQEQLLASGGRPLPTNLAGGIFGFYISGADSGFGELSGAPDSTGKPAIHREGDIIEAGLHYVESLPQNRRENSLKMLELMLRSMDHDPDGYWSKESIVEFLGIGAFWPPTPGTSGFVGARTEESPCPSILLN